MRGLRGRRDPFGSKACLIDRVVVVAGEVLDRATRQPRLDRQADGLGDTRGLVDEPVLEVGRYRQIGCRHDLLGVDQSFVAADCTVGSAGRRRGWWLPGQKSPAR